MTTETTTETTVTVTGYQAAGRADQAIGTAIHAGTDYAWSATVWHADTRYVTVVDADGRLISDHGTRLRHLVPLALLDAIDQAIAAARLDSTATTLVLPALFLDDHIDDRGDDGITVIERSGSSVLARLTERALDELRDDAENYATSPGPDPRLAGLIRSARSTVAAIDAAGR